MNDAKGHASGLLILSLVSVLAVAGVFIWALNQSGFFPGATGLGSTTSVNSTRTTTPVTEISMPDITGIRPETQTTATPPALSLTDKPAEASTTALVTAQDTKTLKPEPAPATQQPEPAMTSPVEIEVATTVAQKTPAPAGLTEKTPATTDSIANTAIHSAQPTKTGDPSPEVAAIPSNEVAENTPALAEAIQSTDISTNNADTETLVQNSADTTAADTAASSTGTTTVGEIAASEPAQNETPVTEEISVANATTLTDEQSAPATAIPEAPQGGLTATTTDAEFTTEPETASKNGWIYAGQYKDGRWLKRGLEVPDTQLPDPGNIYKLTWGTNVRLAPPGKRKQNGSNLAKNIDYLAENDEVEITSIKNSGKTGHIWLEIKY